MIHSLNTLLFLKNYKNDKHSVSKNKLFKSPYIVLELCSYLDEDTLLEIKFVNSSMKEIISKNMKLENVTLKAQLKRIRLNAFGIQNKDNLMTKKVDLELVLKKHVMNQMRNKLSQKLYSMKKPVILLKPKINLIREHQLSQQYYNTKRKGELLAQSNKHKIEELMIFGDYYNRIQIEVHEKVRINHEELRKRLR